MLTVRGYPFLAALAAALVGAGAASTPGPDAQRQARQVLEAAARAYQQVAALKDTLTYTVTTPSAVLEPKTLEIRLGAAHQVAIKDPVIEAIALDGTLYVTKRDAPGKYVARPYSGDFGKALDAAFGEQGSEFEPVQVAMRSGKDLQGWLNALRFKLLGPLEISGYDSKRGGDGRKIDAVHLTADNGAVEADFDAETHFLTQLSIRARPPGAPPEVFIEVSGRLAPEALASAQGLIAFDPAGRVRVEDVTRLDSATLAVGKPAPAFELEKLAGGKLALGALRGSVVVLDFWATWCAPCWKTLGETQHLAEWAAKSGLPVAVFALDTLEEFPTVAEQRARAAAFFKSQGFTMPCLLDRKGEVLEAFGQPGLPSIVVIASDGTIFKYHQGLFPEMLETLKAEVREAAKLATPPPAAPP